MISRGASPPVLHARGRLRVSHGRSLGSQVLARLLRLPRVSEAAETKLVVTSHGAGQRWQRTFDGRRLDSHQHQGADGVIVERFRGLELRFRRETFEGNLLFRQLEAALVCGRLRLRLPAALAPRVEAREDAVGPGRVHVHVGVSLPVLGPLLTYDGTIEIEDPPA